MNGPVTQEQIQTRIKEKALESLQGDWVAQDRHKFRVLRSEESQKPESIKDVRRSDLSIDQLQVFNSLESWVKTASEGVLTFGGYAGTGKSTLIALLAQTVSKKIAFCAMTGKATNVLRQKLKAAGVNLSQHTCETIHGLIYRPLLENEVLIGWALKEIDTVTEYDLIIVDEASMVPSAVLHDLESFGLPILCVGDHGQLAPFGEDMGLMENPQLRLEKIHRQAEGSAIIRLSAYIREQGGLPTRNMEGDGLSYVTPANFMKVLEKKYSGDMPSEVLSSMGVLCFTNRNRCKWNNAIRSIRYPSVDEKTPVEGDLVICLRNSLGVVFNGMRAHVLRVFPSGQHWVDAHLLFNEDDVELKADLFVHQFGKATTFKDFKEVSEYAAFYERGWAKKMGLLFDYGYCLTTHKAQGSSFKEAFVVYERPYNVTQDTFVRWLYTSVTRAAESLVLVMV